jgi:ornithine cyclodeaminase/alanine dehydrogenase-like protein (mu-crystallin family)
MTPAQQNPRTVFDMSAPKKLNVAVIGCGVIAPTHIESYH